jgi:3-hydroxyacyl-CoA dehydrogenase/enoyl-CoA hydratase/3-hydroxybutyryl-CoA epimerase
VLGLVDELNMTLLRKIRDETRHAAEAEGSGWKEHPADAVMDRMIDEFKRPGRHEGAGFYEYEDGKRVRLWTGLKEAFGGENLDIPFKDLQERMMFIESLETVNCISDGVIESIADANIGSVFGIGFPAWTGGVVQFINGYEGGLAGFVARARELAATYGERFEPPLSLVEMAERGESYSDANVLVSGTA